MNTSIFGETLKTYTVKFTFTETLDNENYTEKAQQNIKAFSAEGAEKIATRHFKKWPDFKITSVTLTLNNFTIH